MPLLLDSPHHHTDVGFIDEKSGLALLASALLGGYFQKPPLEPKPLAASWLLRPQEQNAFAKFSAIDAELWHVYFAGPLRGWAVASETTGFAL
jgi:hypothetical protein